MIASNISYTMVTNYRLYEFLNGLSELKIIVFRIYLYIYICSFIYIDLSNYLIY